MDDKPRHGRPKTATDEGTAVAVLASFAKSPTRSTRRLALESCVSRGSIQRIVRDHHWHPYKIQLQQHLSEDHPDRRLHFCEWALTQLPRDPAVGSKILFSDEANFYVSGEVNKQNLRYWSPENPHWTDPRKVTGGGKLMVWCGTWVPDLLVHSSLRAT